MVIRLYLIGIKYWAPPLNIPTPTLAQNSSCRNLGDTQLFLSHVEEPQISELEHIKFLDTFEIAKMFV